MVDRQLQVYNMTGKHPEDKGCSLADAVLGGKSKCTECPFPNDCIMGKHGGTGAPSKQERAMQVTALYSAGATVPIIAGTFRMSAGAVRRDLGGKK